jgi:hypothetical protein
MTCVVGATKLSAALAVSLFAAASAVSGQSGGLFSPAGPERAGAAVSAAAAAVDETALRHRLVTIDFGMLERVRAAAARPNPAPGPGPLTLNLFDGASHELIVDMAEPTFSGGYSVSGRIAGDPPGSATLVVNGPAVAGSVRTTTGTWTISPAGGGRYAITETDPSKMQDACGTPPAGARPPHEPRRRR